MLDKYAPTVWRLVETHYESLIEAEDAFVYVFTLAISRLDKRLSTSLSDAWFEELTKEAVKSAPPALLHDELEQDVEMNARHHEAEVSSDGDADTPTDAISPLDGKDEILPDYLYQKTVQMMRARIATDDAMKHHHGTAKIKLGALSVLVIGVCGVGYGVSDRLFANLHPTTQQSSVANQTAWSNAAGNLPVTPLSIYSLASSSTVDLQHFAVGTSELYKGALVQSADSWPAIHIDGYMFAEANKSMSSAKTQSFKIELVPPLQQSKKSPSSNGNWQIGSWRLDWLDNHWLIAVVDWHNGTTSATPTKQVYGLDLTNQKYSLLDTLRPQSGVANRFVVAVGNGRVVIQSAFADGTGTSVLARPIEVYTMSGSDPLHAWTQSSQIPAPFGFMENPIATKQGLVFQGIAGKGSGSDVNSSTWYNLSWNGQLSNLQGPPVDGQSHWAVVGNSGTLWWVETTPVAAKAASGYQVSMAQLVASTSTNGVKNLNSTVSQLAVSGSNLIWVEPSPGNVDRLVVGQVQ